MNIHNKRQLQNFAIGHLADIDYKDILRIYRSCTKEPYSIFTIDTALPPENPMRFRKKFFRFSLIKIALIEQVKILDDKIKANKTQHELDRAATNISAL